MSRFKLRRPPQVDPLAWELASRGVRLALMEACASTPEAARAAEVQRVKHTTRELERALRQLEGRGPRGEE